MSTFDIWEGVGGTDCEGVEEDEEVDGASDGRIEMEDLPFT
jgi:hypothetical protein